MLVSVLQYYNRKQYYKLLLVRFAFGCLLLLNITYLGYFQTMKLLLLVVLFCDYKIPIIINVSLL